MIPRYGFVLLLLPMLAWAGGVELDRDMRELEQGRDLAAMQARVEQAGETVLATPEGYYWRVRLAVLARDRAAAERLLEAGLASYPQSSLLVLQHSTLRSEGFDEVGTVGRVRLAREVRDGMARAVELDPNSIPARLGLVLFYLNAPRMVGGGVDRAQPHLDFIRERSPMDYFDLQAALAMGRGEMEIALAQFQQATAADPERRTRFEHALTLVRLERFDEARPLLNAIVERFPQHAGAVYQLGRISALDERELDAGIAALKRFLELPAWPMDPPAAAAWWRIGQLHQHRSDLEPARAAFAQALAEDPDFGPASEALSTLTR